MEKVEKNDKPEKVEKEKSKEKTKEKSRSGLQIASFILILVLIALVLIVVQVPYITTDTVSEKVPVEKCSESEIPFTSTFKTGLYYDGASKVYSSYGSALYKYSELKTYLYSYIRNMGDEKGVYCINAEPYLITDFKFTNDQDSFDSFQELLLEESESIQKLDNESSSNYNYPICMEKAISPMQTDIVSLWVPSIISEDIQENYNLKDVYVLFSVVSPTTDKCHTEYQDKETEKEVTRYCNAWKHVVGKC